MIRATNISLHMYKIYKRTFQNQILETVISTTQCFRTFPAPRYNYCNTKPPKKGEYLKFSGLPCTTNPPYFFNSLTIHTSRSNMLVLKCPNKIYNCGKFVKCAIAASESYFAIFTGLMSSFYHYKRVLFTHTQKKTNLSNYLLAVTLTFQRDHLTHYIPRMKLSIISDILSGLRHSSGD